MPVQAWLNRIWYDEAAPPWWLAPASPLYRALAAARRLAYRRGWRPSRRLSRPVIVVGNLSVGGTGKTPLVCWMAAALAAHGHRPGVVTRGYGGKNGRARLIGPGDAAGEVGDEPLLLLRRTGAPVAVGRDRPAAAQLLIDAGCDVIVSDDGLQHYALARDCEIAVVDGRRGFGNGRLLPAGPLREPPSRLQSVHAVVLNVGSPPETPQTSPAAAGAALAASAAAAAAVAAAAVAAAASPGPARVFRMRLHAAEAVAVIGGARRPLSAFAGTAVHAVAGIGHPERFFSMLRERGLGVTPHALPDHAPMGSADILFPDRLPVLMTEKDAVKCGSMADERHWYVPVDAEFAPDDARALLEVVGRSIDAHRVEVGEVTRG